MTLPSPRQRLMLTDKGVKKIIRQIDSFLEKKSWREKPQMDKLVDKTKISDDTLRKILNRSHTVSYRSLEDLFKAFGFKELQQEDYYIPETNLSPTTSPKTRIWVGREDIIDTLPKQLQKENNETVILLITGITGIGKTYLTQQLCDEIQKTWTVEPIGIDFDCREQNSNGNFAIVAPYLLEKAQGQLGVEERKNPELLLNLLVKDLQDNRRLLVLDAVENILKGDSEQGWSEFIDPLWERFFRQLLSKPCKSRIILTSQAEPRYLVQLKEERKLSQPNLICNKLLLGFNEAEQKTFFDECFKRFKPELDWQNLEGNLDAFKKIGELFEGHPLALGIIASEIATDFEGNAVEYWQEYGENLSEIKDKKYEVDDINQDTELPNIHSLSRSLRKVLKVKLEQVFKKLYDEIPNAYQLLCFSSVYNVPVEEKAWLMFLAKLGVSQDEQVAALDALETRFLAMRDRKKLKQHYLIRSTALSHLKKERTPKNNSAS